MKTLIKNGTIITGESSFPGDVLIENGRIVAIQQGLAAPDANIYDAAGCRLFPGFIDAHTHLDMDAGTTVTADNFQTGTAAAIAGGTTTIIDFATQDKGGTLTAALETWMEKAKGLSACDYGFHLAITDWTPAVAREIPELAAAGVTSFKVYLAYDHLRVGDGEIYDILRQVNQVQGILGAHCENGDIINRLTDSLLRQGKKSPCFHPQSRPDLAEAEAISRLTYIGQMAEAPVHIVHLSSQAGLAAALHARQRGGEIYIESCPQYFILDDSSYSLPDFAGGKFVCSPPLRAKPSQAALWEALGQGSIDSISTDHCSFNWKGQKELGRHDFSKIPNGLPGIEHRPALMYSYGVATGRISENQLVASLSENTARLFGLYPRKGKIALGSDGDIVVWDPNTQGTITATYQLQNVDYTPYEGYMIQGSAKAVFLRGSLASENGKVLITDKGKYLPRHGCDYFRRKTE
jgi:dihydropyrimidinase